MKLCDLEALYRFEAFDNAKPPFVSSEDVAKLFTEAEKEACLRADLIREADDPQFCQVQIAVGQPAFELHERVARVTHATFTPTGRDPISLDIVVDRRRLDVLRPRWRTDSRPPQELLIERSHARLACLPDTDGVVDMECFRLPKRPLVKGSDEPEIDEPHHRHLVHWVIKRAYSRPDGETLNPGAAAAADAAFSAYFGAPRDADMLQASEAVPQFNAAVW